MRKKILILEHDDFLREVLGNTLHKQGNYILNGFSIQKGVARAKNENIDYVILGTSCRDYDPKHSLNFIKKQFGPEISIFVINTSESDILHIDKEDQIKTSKLSLESILKRVQTKLAHLA